MTNDTRTSLPRTRILVEGVVIVVSILLAFWIDAAWDGRQEHEREAVYLESLAADARATLANIDRAAGVAEPAERANAALTQAYYRLETPPTDSIELWLRENWSRGEVLPRFGAVRALIATGDLRLIRDETLRSEILRYEWAMETNLQFVALGIEWVDAGLEVLGESLRVRLELRLRSDAEIDSVAASVPFLPYPPRPHRDLPPLDLRALVLDPDTHAVLLEMRRGRGLSRFYRNNMRRLTEEFLAAVEAAQAR